MPDKNCRFEQPKLTNIDDCNICKGVPCRNGYCDCGSGKCMCNPGFTGNNCERNICATDCGVHGTCSAKYLGGEIPVSINRCVCEDGWYGERCDKNTKPTPDLTSLLLCEEKCSGNGGVWPFNCNQNAGKPFAYCGIKGECHYEKNNDPNFCCFTKNCESNSINVPTSPPTNQPPTQQTQVTGTCNGKCKGSFPYGCNSDLKLGYCDSNGGCYYERTNDPYWCCFKGCGSNPTNSPTNPPPTQQTQVTGTCNGKCKGSFPYGCNSDLKVGYCGPKGDCYYERTNDPYWCQFK